MSAFSWWHRLFRKNTQAVSNETSADLRRPDLREFVYLDEVSLRSLLSSQKGGMTESTSEQASEGREAEITGTAGAAPGFIAKAEISSRYQTTNSSTIQTARKATVQSWFRELHELPGLRIVEPRVIDAAVKDLASLRRIESTSELASSEALQRGKLVELRVKLAADRIFHMGTMVSEFTAMAEDSPGMFASGRNLETLREIQPVNKVLQRLLAGLVPIRALAIDYVVVEIDGAEYLAHSRLIDGLDLKTRPLEVVGVTEQEAYWKDLRRVLFSDAEFTVLARISRSGLQSSWTPVKLADLFTEIAPNLVDQINAAGSIPFGGAASGVDEGSPEAQLGSALALYRDSLLGEVGKTLNAAQEQAIAKSITELKGRAATASDQTGAFAQLTKQIFDLIGGEIDSARALELRTAAREASGLSFFPAAGGPGLSRATPTPQQPLGEDAPRLLDVDFVAIYW